MSSRKFRCLGGYRFLSRIFRDFDLRTNIRTFSSEQPAGFGILCRSGSFEDSGRIPAVPKSQAKHNKTEQRCGVPFEVQRITIKSTHSDQWGWFVESVLQIHNIGSGISVGWTCCSDSTDLRYQSSRYSMTRTDVEFRALAVRHGGLNGYQGQ